MTTLWECIWKPSAAILAVWLVTLLLRRHSAALRHFLWLCGLAAFLLVPALSPLAHLTPVMRLAVAVPTALETLPVQVAITPTPQPRRQKSFLRPVTVSRILLWTWLAGSLVICIRRTRAAIRMKGIAGRAAPAPPSLATPHAPPIFISGEVRTALTWGLFRPVILLPSCALRWSADCLRSVLEHEREHIRRWDSLSHWLAEAVCAAWWFNPFVWLARSRAAHERECACDDAVLRSGVRASDYASELLNLASTMPNKGEPIMALSALSNFERRITNLLRSDIDRRPANARARLSVALAAALVIIPLAILRAQAPVGQADLSGTITDPSGARVPNAMVIASGSENREVTRANAAGEWGFSGIPAGDYTVEVQAPGFKAASRTITLAPGQRATLDHALQVGSVRQNIKVIAQGQPRREVSQTNDTPQRIRVGGMVQATRLIRQVKPAYPASAKAQGIEGTILLQAIIGKDGNLLSVTVMNRLADPDLAAAALAAVKQWRYEPTLLNGEPVEVITTVTVDFELQP